MTELAFPLLNLVILGSVIVISIAELAATRAAER